MPRIKPHMPPALEKELLKLGNAFSHVTRIHIVEALTTGPKSVAELQTAVQKIQKGRGKRKRVRQPALSQHLRILRDIGAVLATPNTREVLYTLQVSVLSASLRRVLLRINARKDAWE